MRPAISRFGVPQPSSTLADLPFSVTKAPMSSAFANACSLKRLGPRPADVRQEESLMISILVILAPKYLAAAGCTSFLIQPASAPASSQSTRAGGENVT